MPSQEKLAEFVAWCAKNLTGDEEGQAQLFLDRLFQAFDYGIRLVPDRTSYVIRKRKRAEFVCASVRGAKWETNE